jgi:hypothetical protein
MDGWRDGGMDGWMDGWMDGGRDTLIWSVIDSVVPGRRNLSPTFVSSVLLSLFPCQKSHQVREHWYGIGRNRVVHSYYRLLRLCTLIIRVFIQSFYQLLRLHRWKDGWREGWMDGWVDGRDGRTRRTDGRIGLDGYGAMLVENMLGVISRIVCVRMYNLTIQLEWLKNHKWWRVAGRDSNEVVSKCNSDTLLLSLLFLWFEANEDSLSFLSFGTTDQCLHDLAIFCFRNLVYRDLVDSLDGESSRRKAFTYTVQHKQI